MKTSRCVLGALLLGGLFVLEGCGVGTYRIPNVEPVVKPKPEDDMLADFEAAANEESEPPASKDGDKAEEKPASDEKKSGGDEKKPGADEKKPGADDSSK